MDNFFMFFLTKKKLNVDNCPLVPPNMASSKKFLLLIIYPKGLPCQIMAFKRYWKYLNQGTQFCGSENKITFANHDCSVLRQPCVIRHLE